MITGQALNYEYSRKSLGISSLTFFFLFWPVLFGSTLDLWAIQLSVPGHPGCVGYGFPLMGWASVYTSHILPLPPTLSHHRPAHLAGRTGCGSKDLWQG